MDEYHNSARLRLVGDVHGKRTQYLELVKQANAQGMHTLQVGDLGFSYEYNRLLADDSFDKERNKFFMGNHDCYSMASDVTSFCLGDYGQVTMNGVSFFFVRGAFSIDKKYRKVGLDWFYEEELPLSEFDKVLELYLQHKPDMVVSHDCPDSVGHDNVLKRPEVLLEFGHDPSTFWTNTQMLLQKMLNEHKPKYWYFGHYHKNWESEFRGTKFRCLAELAYVDV